MKVDIDGVRVHITKDIDEFIHKKIRKVNRYLKNTIASHVILRSEKGGYQTEINLLAKGSVINAKDVSSELYSSIEGAIKKIINQSKKYKEKRRSHKAPGRKEVERAINEANRQTDRESDILRITREIPKPMEVDEAIMQLKVSSHDFFIFLNAGTNQINVIYKREDGNFVLVEPS